jgi:hypothetical protein
LWLFYIHSESQRSQLSSCLVAKRDSCCILVCIPWFFFVTLIAYVARPEHQIFWLTMSNRQ